MEKPTLPRLETLEVIGVLAALGGVAYLIYKFTDWGKAAWDDLAGVFKLPELHKSTDVNGNPIDSTAPIGGSLPDESTPNLSGGNESYWDWLRSRNRPEGPVNTSWSTPTEGHLVPSGTGQLFFNGDQLPLEAAEKGITA